MEAKPSTKKSAAQHALEEALNEPLLKLPDGCEYHPVKHQVAPETIFKLSEARLALINGRPGAAEERLARMARIPFRFLDEDDREDGTTLRA